MASVYERSPSKLVQNQKARPFTAGGTIPVTDYPLPKNSLPPKSPSYTFTKDKSQNYIEVAQRNGRKMPGPGDYEVKSCFDTPKKTVKTALGGKQDRKTVVDEIIRVAKLTPGPGHFNPKINNRIIGGMNMKGDRNSFLDECEYLGKVFPGAGKYHPNYQAVAAHTRTPMYK